MTANFEFNRASLCKENEPHPDSCRMTYIFSFRSSVAVIDNNLKAYYVKIQEE
jgi:hypothetical protein